MAKALSPDIDQLKAFARDAILSCGELANRFYRNVKPHECFDESLVTAAELELTAHFQKMLEGTFPAHRMFGSEENADGYTHDQKRYLWIFDPIDGLDNFQAGIPVWAMSLSLMENYWPLFGMIHLPASGDLFHAKAGGEAYYGSYQLQPRVAESTEEERLILTYSRFHRHYRIDFPGKIRNFGCTAAHLCYVAMGRADAAIVTNESFKDLAAAGVIVEAAGGRLFTMSGEPFHAGEYLNGEKIAAHLIAARPDQLDTILSYLHRID